MKIILSNKFYYRRGGDCIYMLDLEHMLKKNGHEVAIFAMDFPKNLESEWSKFFPSNMCNLMALTRPFGSHEVKRKFLKLIVIFIQI